MLPKEKFDGWLWAGWIFLLRARAEPHQQQLVDIPSQQHSTIYAKLAVLLFLQNNILQYPVLYRYLSVPPFMRSNALTKTLWQGPSVHFGADKIISRYQTHKVNMKSYIQGLYQVYMYCVHSEHLHPSPSGDGCRWKRVCLLRLLSGLETRHLSKI